MKEVKMPKVFEDVLRFEQRSRRDDPQAHVSEVLYCLRKSKQNRMLGDKKDFDVVASMAIKRGLALEANFLRPIETQCEYVKGDIIATLDGKIRDDNGKDKYGVELKTRAITGAEPVGAHYIDQVVLYEYVTGLRILLIVYSCFKSGEGTDRLQFFITSEDDYLTRDADWYAWMQNRARQFLKSVREKPNAMMVPAPRFDWECSYCDYWESCPLFYKRCFDLMSNSDSWSKPSWLDKMVKKVTGCATITEAKNAVKWGKFSIAHLEDVALKLAEPENLDIERLGIIARPLDGSDRGEF